MNYEDVKKLNAGSLILRHVEDPEFREYGWLLKDYDFSGLIDYTCKKTLVPKDGNIYVASETALEELSLSIKLEQEVFGSMPIQVGYCNGMNSYLNALEYHKSSEVDIAATDLILLLGRVQDVNSNSYTVDGLQGFYLPAGTGVELYATTLHFSPYKIDETGFRCVVILPSGTNLPLERRERVVDNKASEQVLLFARNKWLIAHPDNKVLQERGAHPGLIGDNLHIRLDPDLETAKGDC